MMCPGEKSLRGHHGGQPDRAGADDHDRVARADLAVEDADLVAGRQDVGEQHRGLVADAWGSWWSGQVGERNAGVLGLDAVDRVTEDPAAAAQALAVVALAAEAAGAAAGDARDQHAVAGPDRADPLPTSSTVPTASWPRIVPGVTSGTSPLRMCRSVPQIVTASTPTIASVSAWTAGPAPPPSSARRGRGTPVPSSSTSCRSLFLMASISPSPLVVSTSRGQRPSRTGLWTHGARIQLGIPCGRWETHGPWAPVAMAVATVAGRSRTLMWC